MAGPMHYIGKEADNASFSSGFVVLVHEIGSGKWYIAVGDRTAVRHLRLLDTTPSSKTNRLGRR